MDYLNIYLQIAISVSIITLVKDLLWTFKYRYEVYKGRWDWLEGANYAERYFFIHNNTFKEYFECVISALITGIFWPFRILGCL